MSQGNAAQKQQQEPRDDLRAQVRELRSLVADMAFLFLPPALRTKCECGRIACRKVTCSKPGVTGYPKGPQNPNGEAEPRQYTLCDECQLPEGWNAISNLELGPVERETVRLANRLILVEPKA